MSESPQATRHLETAAASIVREVCGVRPAKVERIPRGVMTFKFMAAVPSRERFVVRFYPATRTHVVDFEPDILRRCADAAIPVPWVVADSRSGPAAPLAYIVYRMIDGVPLSDRLAALTPACLGRIAARLVMCLQALQEIAVAGHGEMLDAARARFDTETAFVEHSFAEGIRALERHVLLPPELVGDIVAVGKHLNQFPAADRSGLTWPDISPDNVVLDRADRLAALLDFEGVLAGDLLLNLGYCQAAYRGTPLFDALRDAWPSPLTEEHWTRVELYVVLRALRIAKFAHEPLPTGHVRTPLAQLLPGLRPAIVSLRKRLVAK